MNKKIITLSISIIFISLIGVGLYYYFHPKKAIRIVLPEFTGENHVKAVIKNDTAFISLESYLNNSSPYNIGIDSIHYNVFLDTTRIINEKKQLALSQKAGTIDTAVLEFRLPIKKLQSTISKIQSKDSTYIKANFKLFYNTIFGAMDMEFSKKKKIDVPIPPEIKLVKVHKKDINILKGKASLAIDLEVINHSSIININLSDVKYNLQVGEEMMAVGSMNNDITLSPKSSTVVTVPVSLDVDHPFRVLWDVFIKNKKEDYSVVLTAMLSNEKISKIPIEIIVKGNRALIK